MRTKCVFFTKWLVLTQTQEVELMDSKHRQIPARNEITFNKPHNGRKTYTENKKTDKHKPPTNGLSKFLHHDMEYH